MSSWSGHASVWRIDTLLGEGILSKSCLLMSNETASQYLWPRLPKAGVGHKAFRRDVTPVCA